MTLPLVLSGALLAATGAVQHGTFALQGGMQKTQAYLRDTVRAGVHRFDIWYTRSAGAAALTSYDLDMTKRLHLIVISDDFRQFYHIHPVLRGGHFTIAQALPPRVRYDVYSDATPHGIGQQVFRFAVGNAAAASSRDLSERGTRANAGAYTVALSTNKVRAGSAVIDISITKNGKPANDLTEYLGAAAHAVFINARDLSYVHAHPMTGGMSMGHGGMDMDMDESTPKELPPGAHVASMMMLHAQIQEAGTYKLWLQFRGGGRLHVAPFVITAFASK